MDEPRTTLTDEQAADQAMRAAVAARVAAERRQVAGGSDGDVDADFIRRCLHRNELGDGELYARLHQGEYIYNTAAGDWMAYNGHHWALDTQYRHLAAVENVVACYEGYASDLLDQMRDMEAGHTGKASMEATYKQLKKRADSLRGTRRRSACIAMAHTCADPISIDGSQIDTDPYALPCANGVIDLKTGELMPGRPDQYLLKASPAKWQGIDAPCPTWESFIYDIMSGSQPLVDFLQRALGFALIGEIMQSVFFVLTGQGRNGKSLLVKAMSEVLGPLAQPIASAMLLDQNRNTNPSAPTPEIMTLRGLRVAFASETDAGCKISPSRVKWLTGNDRLTGRNPHDKHEVQFEPTHTLFLLTNHKPHAPASDFAFWERMFLIPFGLSYVNREPKAPNERRADPKLINKIRQETSGVLAWLVKGCLLYQAAGDLQPPAAVLEAVDEYKREEDTIADFIEECCYLDADTMTQAKELYDVFEVWWKRNVSNYAPKQKWFGTLFGRRFDRVRSGTVSYRGVGLTVGVEDLKPAK